MKLLPAAFELPRQIRPRHCPVNQDLKDVTLNEEGVCDDCDGRGFLYPDPPEWWLTERDLDDQLNPAERTWEWFCEDVWRVLGIVEVDGE